jgi:hypothetical protein
LQTRHSVHATSCNLCAQGVQWGGVRDTVHSRPSVSRMGGCGNQTALFTLLMLTQGHLATALVPEVVRPMSPVTTLPWDRSLVLTWLFCVTAGEQSPLSGHPLQDTSLLSWSPCPRMNEQGPGALPQFLAWDRGPSKWQSHCVTGGSGGTGEHCGKERLTFKMSQR